jgi:hypothetical protein
VFIKVGTQSHISQLIIPVNFVTPPAPASMDLYMNGTLLQNNNTIVPIRTMTSLGSTIDLNFNSTVKAALGVSGVPHQFTN